MAASLSITPTSYNGTYTYVNADASVSVSGSFCVDNTKIISLAGEISGVGSFAGTYNNTTSAVAYKILPDALTDADALADAATEVAAAISENFWPTPPAEESPAEEGGE